MINSVKMKALKFLPILPLILLVNHENHFMECKKCGNTSMANISKRLRKHIDYMEVESHGHEGALVTMSDSRMIQVLSKEATKNFIAVEAQTTGNSESYLCTNVYGPQKLEDKISFLSSLLGLKYRHPSSKCIMGGDFNLITTLLEKKGGISKLNKDAELFTYFIDTAKE